MWVRGGLMFSSSSCVLPRACMSIHRDPPLTIPMYITIRDCHSSQPALGLWYGPFGWCRIMRSTWVKWKRNILRVCNTQMEKELDCHFLGDWVIFLTYQSFIIHHGVRRSGHLVQIWELFASNPLDGVMGYQRGITHLLHLWGCSCGQTPSTVTQNFPGTFR